MYNKPPTLVTRYQWLPYNWSNLWFPNLVVSLSFCLAAVMEEPQQQSGSRYSMRTRPQSKPVGDTKENAKTGM